MTLHGALTDSLVADHALIRRVVAVLRRLADEMRGGHFRSDAVVTVLRFLREFAEHQHHRKEESLLMATLAAHGDDHGATRLGVLLRDHEETRELLYGLTLFWEPGPHISDEERAAFVRLADSYGERIVRHMDHEEKVVFPLAERLVPGDERIGLLADFARIDAGRSGRREWEGEVAALEAAG